MKKLLCILGLAIIFYACSEDEIVYSCDLEIDAIVKSGEIQNSELTLSEFLEYDLALQKALFRSFTTEKQKAFWLEKLDSVMVSELVTTLELAHVDSLSSFIASNYGTVSPLSQQTFERNWISYSRDTLLWDDATIYFIISSLCISQSHYELLMQTVQQPTTRGPNDCGCSTQSDYCADQGGVCDEGDCNLASIGCGWLWGYDCDGGCV